MKRQLGQVDARKATRQTQFYQAAIERRKDAQALLDRNRPHGAIYMAGYVIECFLKFILCERMRFLYIEDLEVYLERQTGYRPPLRGRKGHALDSLLEMARLDQQLFADPLVRKHFNAVNQWSVAMRYDPSVGDRKDAASFLESVDVVRAWLQSRA